MHSQLQKFLQVIREPLAALLPGLQVDVSEPYYPTGVWIVDLFLGDYHLVVQFTEDQGFGLTAGDDDWDTSIDEVLPDAGAAVMRVLELLRAKGRTIPTTTLQGLRAKKSQREVADAMDIKQPSYARMENEELSKLKIQTLQKIVAASQGKLHLLVETIQGDYFILNNNLEKNVKEEGSKNFPYQISAGVPLHLVNLAPRRSEFSAYEDIFRSAFSISMNYRWGENVKLIPQSKCEKIKSDYFIDEFFGRAPDYKVMTVCDMAKKDLKHDNRGVKQLLRSVK